LENTPPPSTEEQGLVRGFGLLQATALNMSNMVGVGPFITIPLIIAAMGGPQCMLGWMLGAVLALCDGLVWSELAAAMPERAAPTTTCTKCSARPDWAASALPLHLAVHLQRPAGDRIGLHRFAQYVGYFWHGMGPAETRMVCLAVGAAVIVMLYRGVTAVGRLAVVLWIGMLITVFWIIVTGL
jgi:amino acid transporter